MDSTKRDRFLDRASAKTSTSLYPTEGVRDEAVALLAAHNLKSADNSSGGGSGVVQSERVGPLSVTYATGSGSAGDLGSTSYGIQLAELVKSYSFGPRTQNEPPFGCDW